MHLELIRNTNNFNVLESEWNDLLTCCSASHVPFLRHEFLFAWWRTLGGGEWGYGELNILTARDDDDQLIAIGPLFLTENHEGIPALMFIGSIEISDYLDLIVAPSEISQFVENLLDFLDADRSIQWQVLDLYNIPEDSPTLPALKSEARQRGWEYKQEQLQPCPYIPLPGDWEAYLAAINKKQRHEIRRKIRRAESHPDPVRWYIVEDENTLEAETEAFLTLMSQDPEKEHFLTDVMRSQMHDIIQAAFRAGWLQLAFLEVAGKKAAGYLNFDFAGHIWLYNSGINLEFRELSPGWVLLSYILKWANENKREVLDFMRGDEAYKYRFGGINRFVVRATVRRKSP